jgi:hypothetical protein
MRFKIIAALGAILLLALSGPSADARSMGGGGGHFGGGGGGHFGGGGGGHFGGGGGHFGGRSGGGGFAARSFRGGPSFGGRSFRDQSFRGQSFRGRSFRGESYRGSPSRGDRSFRHGRGYASGSGDRWRGGKHGRHHHRRGYPIIVGGGYYDDYDYDVGYYGDDCGWLNRKAVRTGSPYWWRRYQACEG